MKYFYVFMAIDEQLLNQNNGAESEEEIDEESMAAGDFREERRSTGLDEINNPNASIREQVQQDKRRRVEQLAADERSQISRDGDTPIRKATDSALKFAWTNLIDSFGLTLFWIDIHFFLNKVFGPKVFRELGEEWIPAGIKKLGDQKSKEAAAMLTLAEKAGCGCLNLGCLFLVIAILSVFAMIASAVTSPFKTLYDILFSGGLSGFLDMIKNLW